VPRPIAMSLPPLEVGKEFDLVWEWWIVAPLELLQAELGLVIC